jgi:hypothetical protein
VSEELLLSILVQPLAQRSNAARTTGGADADAASYEGETGFVTVNLETGIATVTKNGLVVDRDTLAEIENVVAGSGGAC